MLDKRHSVRGGCCDVHASYVNNVQSVAKLLVKADDGSILAVIKICRPCARALAKNARLQGET